MFFLLGIVLLIFVPSPWNVVSATVCLVLFCGSSLLELDDARTRKVVEAQTLVEILAQVLAPCRPKRVEVRISGEIWRARSEAGADTVPSRRPPERAHARRRAPSDQTRSFIARFQVINATGSPGHQQ